MVTVLCRPGGASHVEKSPRLNWTTQFLTVAYDCACSPNVSFRMAWISFGALPFRGEKVWWQLSSPCCWNRARRLTCFLSAYVTRKDLQFGTWTDPSFQIHYRFRLRHREVGRAKDLSSSVLGKWDLICTNNWFILKCNWGVYIYHFSLVDFVVSECRNVFLLCSMPSVDFSL